MPRIVLAMVLSFLCPGLGQIYNKQPKRGIAMLVVSVLLLVLPSLWVVRQISARAPELQSGKFDPGEMQRAATAVISENKHALNWISFAFLALWAYSISQAYFRAKELAGAPPAEPENPGEGPSS